MKKLLILSLFSFLLFFGCNQDSGVTSPINNSSNSQLKLISLPAPSGGLNIETLITKSKYIDGRYGGEFNADIGYQGGPYGYIDIDSDLDFNDYSFEGTKVISQTLDTDFALVTFGPSIQFNRAVEYDLRIEGLDLSNVNPKTLDFVYVDSNGNMYAVDYDNVTMDASTGMLKVKNAELNHFSRYGFVN